MVHICDCGFSAQRIDSFKRHKESHQKIKKLCKCGRKVSSGNYARHLKSKKCSLKSQPNVNIVHNVPESIKSKLIQQHNIQTILKLVTTNDDSVILLHEEITIGGIQLVLVAVPNGKLNF